MAESVANVEIPASQVLYVNNLNDRLSIDILKKQLYMVFSQYGKVQEVIAFPGIKGKGQAWILYENLSSASTALRSKQGFNFYDKPMRIAYAKIKPSSVAVAEKVAAGKVVKDKKGDDSSKKRKVESADEEPAKKAKEEF